MDLKKEAKTLGKHSAIYGLGGVLSQTVGFIMLPVYTRFLTPSDYGIMELLAITTDLLSTVIAVGIATAMFRFYYEYENEKDRGEVISTAIISFSVLAISASAFLSIWTNQFSALIIGESGYSSYFIVSFATIWFNTLIRMAMDYIRIQEKSVTYLFASIGRLIMALSLNIYLIIFLGKGVMGILLSTLITGVVFSALLVIPMLYRTGLRFSMTKFKKMLRFGAPLIMSEIGRITAGRSDRYFIRGFDNLAATGIYSLGFKFGTLVHTFVTSPFIQIWVPRRMATFRKENAEETFSRIFTYYVFLSTFVGLGISVLVKDVLRIMATPAFFEAYKIVPVIILANIIFGFYYHFSTGIYIAKKTGYIAYLDMANAALNIVLNFILIRRYLAWGAAASALLCCIFRSGFSYVLASRTYPIRFETWRVARLILSAAALYWLSTFLDFGSPWVNIPCKSLVALAYPGVLLLTGFFDDKETSELRTMWATVWARVPRRV